MSGQPLSALATTLAACLEECNSRRVPLSVIRDRAYRVHPWLHGDLDARSHLRAALDELAAAGVACMPAPRSKNGWERSMLPLLPAWVATTGQATAVTINRLGRKIYPDWLQAAAAIASRDDEFELLNKLTDWRRNRPNLMMVPIEERSLELFGDEKALGQRAGTRLFTSGALTLEALGCHRTPLPLPSRHIAGILPTRLLVCENSATYYSTIKAAEALPPSDRPDLHVAFGVGNQFSVGHAEIAFLDPIPVRALYCGDLDIAGIQIAARAARAIAGDLPLRPAVAHYEWMLEHGTRQRDRSGREGVDLAQTLSWFPPALRPPVLKLLTSGMRISQETVGLQTLTEHPDLIRGL